MTVVAVVVAVLVALPVIGWLAEIAKQARRCAAALEELAHRAEDERP